MKRIEIARIEKTVEKINIQSLILDIGCGEGIYLKRLPQTVGLDISSVRIRRARNKGRPLVIAIGENLPFRSGIFSLITCIDIIEHVFDQKKLYQGIKHAQKEKGYLIICRCNPFIESIGGLIFAPFQGNRRIDKHILGPIPVPEEHLKFPTKEDILTGFNGILLDSWVIPFPFLPFAFNKTEFYLLQKKH